MSRDKYLAISDLSLRKPFLDDLSQYCIQKDVFMLASLNNRLVLQKSSQILKCILGSCKS